MGRAAAAVESEKRAEEDLGLGGEPWRTILFNCECHTFDEVERIVMKAVRCTLSQARRISWEVHSKGSAVVYEGPRERCEAVAEVIASVGLRVEVSR
ncbi:MAG: ATP-dependent Clp protease adaptor ClpS [Elusimicrobia bacterium]|nr:ATP-dependent Clp protease adaptor ClpS [Elusimicrobiota bacterium]